MAKTFQKKKLGPNVVYDFFGNMKYAKNTRNPFVATVVSVVDIKQSLLLTI